MLPALPALGAILRFLHVLDIFGSTCRRAGGPSGGARLAVVRPVDGLSGGRRSRNIDTGSARIGLRSVRVVLRVRCARSARRQRHGNADGRQLFHLRSSLLIAHGVLNAALRWPFRAHEDLSDAPRPPGGEQKAPHVEAFILGPRQARTRGFIREFSGSPGRHRGAGQQGRRQGDPGAAEQVAWDWYGNSRQLHFIEKWFPGKRLTVGLVKMSILQELADTSEVFTKE
jgi:hypothetical protein